VDSFDLKSKIWQGLQRQEGGSVEDDLFPEPPMPELELEMGELYEAMDQHLA
jgi:hypothetical protein